MSRRILHVDLDAFFASVEQLDNPDLRGKPVLVGGPGPRGVVAAASYEARAFGCRSAMPGVVARRLCPHAIFVRGNYERYKQLSGQVFSILGSVTPIVQPVSIDEAYLDVTATCPTLDHARATAAHIRARIKADTGLTASVGVAENKFLAKVASDLEKPDGLCVIAPDKVHDILDPLAVSAIHGIGPAAERRLNSLGIRTIAQLRVTSEALASRALGSFGPTAVARARGLDDRPVRTERTRKSIGHENTWYPDIADRARCRAITIEFAERVARSLREKDLFARTVTLKLRHGDFETHTVSQTLEEATDQTAELAHAAGTLFDGWAAARFRPLRLIGVTLSGLTDRPARQLGLFDQAERDRQARLDDTADAIARKFGTRAIRRGL